MSDALADLEIRRAEIQFQVAHPGDMRTGSITFTGGRCGNPNSHCRQFLTQLLKWSAPAAD